MAENDNKSDTTDMSFAIVASRFHDFIVDNLIKASTSKLLELGVPEQSIKLFEVPGAFEIPGVARKLVQFGNFDGIICLGVVIRGGTPHFDYVAGESAREIAHLAARSPVPVIYGVLTTDDVEQALERAKPKGENKGADAAVAAVEMVTLYAKLKSTLFPKWWQQGDDFKALDNQPGAS